MPCYRPLKGWRYTANHLDPDAIRCRKPSQAKYRFSSPPTNSTFPIERKDIPCRKCIGCRLEYSRQWAIRMQHESLMHTDNAFLTLTYDEHHIPKDGSIKKNTFKTSTNAFASIFNAISTKIFVITPLANTATKTDAPTTTTAYSVMPSSMTASSKKLVRVGISYIPLQHWINFGKWGMLISENSLLNRLLTALDTSAKKSMANSLKHTTKANSLNFPSNLNL